MIIIQSLYIIQVAGNKSQRTNERGKRSTSQSSSHREDATRANNSRSNSRQSIEAIELGEDVMEQQQTGSRVHKYIVEAVVLKESWPMSPAHWEFVGKLKEAEKQELKGGLCNFE